MDLMGKLKGAAEKATDFGGVATAKVNELLDDYKNALDVLAKFGFSVGKFQVEMGILPEVRTSISGSVASIRDDQLKAMEEEYKENKLLVTMLSALVTAKGFSERVQLKASSVTLNIKLGLPPSIAVHFD